MLKIQPATKVLSSSQVATTWQRFADLVMDRNALNFWASRFNSLWSLDQPMARIVARSQTASHSVTLVLKPNRHVIMPKAGQHIVVSADINGIRTARSYSPSYVANQPGLLAITVKQVDGGRLSNWLCLQARKGDVLQLGQPFGEFEWPAQQQPVLLLAAGSGITPLISLLRQHLRVSSSHAQPVQLHYWVHSQSYLFCIPQDKLMTSPAQYC